jgi:hypothetical protein
MKIRILDQIIALKDNLNFFFSMLINRNKTWKSTYLFIEEFKCRTKKKGITLFVI